MKPLTLAVTLALIPALTGISTAQKRKGAKRETRRSQSGSARSGLNRRFNESGPAIGEQLPDLRVYDADGKKFRLRSVKGQYTVLVFGCLT